MTSKPLFSIISITRNNLPGLQKTYASLQAQDFKNYEWIVIDGASDDGTKDWLKNTEAHGISEPDDGIYDAMNKGLRKAMGDYVLFLNAGDMLADDTTLTKLAPHGGPDFLYGDSYEQLADGTQFYKRARSHHKLARGMFTHHQAMLYRRKALGGMHYDRHYKIAADYDLTCRFLNAGASALYVPSPVCVFAPGGISQRLASAGRREEFKIRQVQNLCSPLQSILISLRQKLTYTLKTLTPGLYHALRRFNPPF